MFPIIPVVATAGLAGLSYLIFGGKKEPKTEPTPVTPSNASPPIIPPSPMPSPAPAPAPLPDFPIPPPGVVIPPKYGQGVDIPVKVSGKVIAPSGLWVRDAPRTSAKKLTLAAFGSNLGILNPTSKNPPTAGAPFGWWNVRTDSGVTGFASAEFITLGGMVPNIPSVPNIPNIPNVPSIPNIVPLPSPPLPGPQPAPSPLPMPNILGTAKVTARSGLNIRSAPNTTGSRVIMTAPYGSTLNITENNLYPPTPDATKGWYKVSVGGAANGFASAEWVAVGTNIAPPPGPAPEPPSPPPIFIQTASVTATGGLNVRSAPSTSGTVLATLPLNSKIVVREPSPTPPTPGAPQGWYKITTSTGITGYASAQYIALDVNVSVGPAKMEGEFGSSRLYGSKIKNSSIKM